MGQGWDGPEEVMAMVRALGVPHTIAAAIEQLIRHHAEPVRTVALPKVQVDGAPGSIEGKSSPRDVGALAALFHRRALRRVELLGDLASDLAWQMLRALTAEDAKGNGITVSGLCVASGGSPTTALRHIAAMERQGLIRRTHCIKDGRRTWIYLTDSTRERMHAMLIDFCIPAPPPRLPARPTLFAD